jgi:hypothetical protein
MQRRSEVSLDAPRAMLDERKGERQKWLPSPLTPDSTLADRTVKADARLPFREAG